MEISDLKLINYRSFGEQYLKFDTKGSLLFGKNGIGKTNLLEAIAYFAFGKSFRANKDFELINFSKDFFRLEAHFNLNEKKHYFEAAANKNRKILKIDDTIVSKISNLYNYLKVVYFSPEDINIISLSPSYRRKFLNMALSQYSFEYMQNLRNYHKLIRQRNALLKTDFSLAEKKSWDKQLIENILKITSSRLNYLDEFKPLLIKYYQTISGKNEELNLEYRYSYPVGNPDLKDNILEQLERIQEQEKEQQRTLLGPHLDDLEFFINGHSARRFGSQGQLRTIAIASKLVQAELITEHNNEAPILMFDDVLADLDKARSEKIIKMLSKKHQIFIATPNKDIYQRFDLQEIDLENFSNMEIQ